MSAVDTAVKYKEVLKRRYLKKQSGSFKNCSLNAVANNTCSIKTFLFQDHWC